MEVQIKDVRSIGIETIDQLNRCMNRLLDLDPVGSEARNLFFKARDEGKSKKEAELAGLRYIWAHEQGGRQ